MKRKSLVLSLWILVCTAVTASGSVLDAPHNETNNMVCGSCHTYSLWWQYSPELQNLSPDHDTIVSAVCLTCHDTGSSLPVIKTHSGTDIGSTTYHGGAWGAACSDCHNPHYQDQLNWLGVADPYLLTGTITSAVADSPVAGQTTITYSGATSNANWPAGSWASKNSSGRGLILVHDKSQTANTYTILSDNATTSQLVINGILDPIEIAPATCTYTNCATDCNSFGLIYGQLIRDSIETPSSGTKDVQFFDPNGGFVDANWTGVCQVCHTQTLHYTNTDPLPSGADTHALRNGSNCITCHGHNDGFKGAGHDGSHFVADSINGLDCSICHDATGSDIVQAIHKGSCGTCHLDPGGGGTLIVGDATNGVDGDATGESGKNFTSSCNDCHNNGTKAAVNTVPDIHHLESPNSYASTGDCIQCHIDTKLAANHSTQISDATASCSTAGCHENNVGAASGAPVDINDALTHDSCTTCHELTTGALKAAYGRADQMPDGGVGSSNGGGACAACHTLYDSNDHATDHDSTGYDTTPKQELATLDCAGCHSAWANVNTSHVGRTILRGNIGGVGTIGNTINCTTCHNSSITIVADAIAAGKAGTLVSCADCHGLRIASHPADTMPDHTGYLLKSAGQCLSCHDQAGTAAVVNDIHNNTCTNCHDAAFNLKVGDLGNGDATQHTVGGSSDCTVCHSLYNTDFSTGHTNEDHSLVTSTTDNTCDKCHTYTTSVVFDIHNNSCELCHTDTTTPGTNGTLTGSASSHTVGVASNCATCHTTRDSNDHVSEHDATAMDRADEPAALTCSTCHSTFTNVNTAHVGLTIKRGSINGAGTIDSTISCATCHSSTDTGVVAAIADGKAATTVYCADCHGLRATDHPNDVAPDHAVFLPKTASQCTSCHDQAGSVVVQTGIHASCQSCHDAAYGLLSSANGDATQHTAGGSSDCTVCHASYNTDFGTGHKSEDHGLVASTTDNTCDKCHTYTTSVVVDIHNNSCELCHIDTTTPGTDGSLKGSAANHTIGVVSNCATCHTTRDANDHVSEHNTTSMARSDEPVSLTCTDCHAGFSNINTAHVGLTIERGAINGVGAIGSAIDCATCHSSTDTGVVAAITAGKAGTANYCADCHGLRATDHPNDVAPDHAVFLPKTASQCTSCHDQAGSVVVQTGIHSSCLTCHTATYGLRVGPNGDATAHTLGGSSECTVCHDGYNTDFQTGHQNEDHALVISTTDNSCDKCHTYTTSVVVDIHNNSCELCHTDTTLPTTNGSLIGSASNHTVGVASNCAACHTTRDGNDHVAEHDSTAIGSPAEPAGLNCTGCHAAFNNINTAHMGRTISYGEIGGAGSIGSTIDCATCHSSTVQAVSNAIAAGKTGVTVYCNDCHGLRALNHPTVPPPAHSSYLLKTAAQCTNCHDQSGSSDVVSGIHADNCNTCHSPVDWSLRVGTNGDATLHTPGGSSDCTVCHTVYNADFATGHINEDHGLVTSTTDNSCDKCHSYTTSVVVDIHNNSCELCHTDTTTPGTNGSLKGSAANHTIGVASNCATCHTTRDANDHLSEHDATGDARADEPVSLTCGDCHGSFANINSGHVGRTVTRGVLNGSGTIGATIDCATCHSSAVQAVIDTIMTGKGGATVYCADCHDLRPVEHPADIMPSHTGFLPKTASQCVSCHDQAGTADVVSSVHSGNCQTCHDATYGLRSGANGDATQHGAIGQGNTSDCTVCHSGYNTDFETGHQNEDHALVVSTTDNSCDKCHTYTTSVVVDIHNNSCELCHSDTTLPGTNGSLSGSATNHTIGQTSDCANCHNTRDGNDHVAEHDATDLGRADEPAALTCTTCHSSFTNINTAHVGLTIERGGINGAGTVGNSIDCATCHSATDTGVVAAIAAGKGGTTTYCADCHGLRAVDHPVDVQPDHSILLPKTATQCTSCHDQSGATDVQIGIHTSCFNCHDEVYALRAGGNGDATNHVVGLGSDCTVCHAQYDTNFATGHVTEDHGLVVSTTDNSCDKCHTYTTSVVVDIHNNSCELCHTDTTLPGTNGTLKGSAANHTVGAPSNCATCHTTRDANDHVAEHDATDLARADEPAALTCTTCHSSFTNINTAHVGLTIERGGINGVGTVGNSIDCATCHSSAVQGVIDAIASGKAGTTTYCADCHGLRATDHPNDVAPDHAAFLAKTASQCTSCHDQAGTVVVQTGIHTNCLTCHTADYGLKTGANGDATLHTLGGSSDCTVCHGGYNTDFALGHQNENHALVISTTDNSCDKCHTYTTSVVVDVHGNSCELCHTDTTTPGTNGSLTGSAAGHTIGVASDCAACHTTRDANDHVSEHNTTSMARGDEPGGLTCTTCHAGFSNINTAHVGLIVERGGIHGAGTIGATVGCATCHSSANAGVVAAIAAGKAGSTNYCADCHSVRAANHPVDVQPDHAAFLPKSAGQCTSCHDQSGTVNVQTGVHASCFNCHTASYGLRAGTNGDATQHVLGGSSDCTVCHSAYNSDFGLGHKNEDHALVASTTNNTCDRCHTYTTSVVVDVHGNNCELCHTDTTTPGTNGTLTGSAAGHTMGVTSDCSSCHSSRDANDHLSEHDATAYENSPTQETNPAIIGQCATCHDTMGFTNINSGHVGRTVSNGAINGAGTIGSTISCTTCHSSTDANVIAAIAAGKLGTIVSCADCHTPRGVPHGGHPTPDTIALAAEACTVCHDNDSNNPKEVVAGIHNNTCSNCHTSPPVLDDPANKPNAIAITGGGDCMTCHGTAYNHANDLHSKIAYGDPATTGSIAGCTGCHNVDPLLEHTGTSQTGRAWDCAVCHSNPCFDTIISDSINNGTTVYCTACHDANKTGLIGLPFPHGKAPADHNVKNTSNCEVCHVVTTNALEDIHMIGGNAGNCDMCHAYTVAGATSAKPPVEATVAAVIAAGGGTCEDCHGSNHSADHNNITLPSAAGCNSCHATGSTFDEVVSLHWNGCVRCHTSTDPTVTGVINTGSNNMAYNGSGSAVSCEDCHANGHHDSPYAQAGDCTYCHADPRGGWQASFGDGTTLAASTTKQLACVECHVEGGRNQTANGLTILKNVLNFDGTAPTQTIIHQITGNAPIKVYDFGACLSCHSVGGGATPVNLYHAKPVRQEIWGNNPTAEEQAAGAVRDTNSTANDNMCLQLDGHPGKRTFNIMTLALGDLDARYGKPYDPNKNHRDFCRATQETGPVAPYNSYITVPCNSTTDSEGQCGLLASQDSGFGTTSTRARIPYFADIPAPTVSANDSVFVAKATWNETGASQLRVVAYNGFDNKNGTSLTVSYSSISNAAMAWNATLGGWEYTSPGTVSYVAGDVVVTSSGSGTPSHQRFADNMTAGSGGGGTAEPAQLHFDNPVNTPASSTNYGTCDSCHSGNLATEHYGQGIGCTACHGSGCVDPVVTAAVTAGSPSQGGTPSAVDCFSCHYQSAAQPANHPEDVMPAHNFLNSKAECVTCHTGDIAAAVHTACGSCHGAVFDKNNMASGANGDATLHVVGNSSDCGVCHVDYNGQAAGSFEAGHKSENHLEVTATSNATPTLNCAGCHTGDLISGANNHNNNCEACHTDRTLNGAFRAGVIGDATGHVIGAASDCAACHNAAYFDSHDHGSDTDGGTAAHTTAQNTAVLASGGDRAQAGEQLCSDCHGDYDIANSTAVGLTTWEAVIWEHDLDGTKDGIGACTTCHDSARNTNVDTGKGFSSVQNVITAGGAIQCLDCHIDKQAPASHGIDHSSTGIGVVLDTVSCITVGCHDGGDAVMATHKANCMNCHSSATPSMGNAPLRTDIPTANGSIVMANGGACADCHANRDADWYSHQVDHTAAGMNVVLSDTDTTQGRADCNYCHNEADIILGTHDRASAGGNAACVKCHSADGSLIPPAVANGGPCTTCHVSYFDGHDHGSDTDGGSWAHSTALDTALLPTGDRISGDIICSTCHQDYTGTTASLDTWLGIMFEHDLDGTKDGIGSCTTCHDSARTINVDTGKGYTSVLNVITIATSAQCADCHKDKQGANHGGHQEGDGIITWTGMIDCQGCHGVGGSSTNAPKGAVYDSIHDIDNNGQADCALCHAGGVGGAVPSSGSALNATTGGAWNGRPYVCTNCHTGYFDSHNHGTGSVHTVTYDPTGGDTSQSGSKGCADCHGVGAAPGPYSLASWSDILFEHSNSCATCHSYDGTNGKYNTMTASWVTTAINNAGTAANCRTCHQDKVPSVSHGGHDNTHFSGDTVCTTCHTIPAEGIVAGVHNNDCLLCHDNSSGGTGTTISGVDGNATLGNSAAPHSGVSCLTCHPSTTYPADAIHHDSAHPQAGDCTYCHADPRGGWQSSFGDGTTQAASTTKQLACVECHVEGGRNQTANGLTINKLTLQFNGSAPTATPQHVISGNAPIEVYDFGACLSCHSVGGGATPVNLYHAKPVRQEIWGNNPTAAEQAAGAVRDTNSTANDNMCLQLDGHPGKRTFNIMTLALGDLDARYGKPYDPNKNHRDFCQATQEIGPVAPYNSYITVPCNSTTDSEGQCGLLASQDSAFGTTSTRARIPYFADIPAPTFPDNVQVQSAVWDGATLTVTATNDDGCNAMSVVTQPDGTNRGTMNGTTTCTLNVSVGSLPGTVDVNTTNPLGTSVTGYAVSDNSAPTPALAIDDPSMTAAASGVTTLDVMVNDQGTGRTITSITQPALGSVAIANGGANVNYTGAGEGSTSFTYTITASDSSTSTATVTVTVSAVGGSSFIDKGIVASVNASWQAVSFNNTFAVTPVVVATKVETATTNVSSSVRIRNVSTTGFEVMVQESDVANGTPATVAVHWVAVEPGVYTSAADGITMEAVLYTSTVTDDSTSWVGELQAYQQAYTTPVVVGQVQTANDARWSEFWANGGGQTTAVSSTTLYTGKHVGEDPTATRADETVGYIVIEASTGTVAGVGYEAGISGNTIRGYTNTPPFNTALSGSLATVSTAVASNHMMGGANGAYIVMNGFSSSPLTTTNISLLAEEDTEADTERAHATTIVGYLVFEDAAFAAGNTAPTASPDSATVTEGTTDNAIDVLANDSDPDAGDVLSVNAITVQGTKGTAVANGSNVLYTPSVAGPDTDTFTYQVSDGNGGYATAQVTVTIEAVVAGLCPTGTASGALTFNIDRLRWDNESGKDELDVRVNFGSDPTSTIANVYVSYEHSGGTVLDTYAMTYSGYNNQNGIWEYEALDGSQNSPQNTGWNTDAAAYIWATDSGGNIVDKQCCLAVTRRADSAISTPSCGGGAGNNAPTANNDSFTVDQDTTANVLNVLGNDSDPDAGDTISILSTGSSVNGSVITNNGSNILYSPAAGWSGVDTFDYTITDGNGGTATAQVTVTVNAGASCPANPGTISATVDRFRFDSGNREVDIRVGTSQYQSGDVLHATYYGGGDLVNPVFEDYQGCAWDSGNSRFNCSYGTGTLPSENAGDARLGHLWITRSGTPLWSACDQTPGFR